MKNARLTPFERNRYFPGKLLTSADFLAEQTYFNSKRRFMNSLLFGPGVVCGLSVYNLDDLSLMLESGAAVDASGREIVLENSSVKKLSAIEGFDELETDDVCLCLRYKEEETRPVYSIGACANLENSENFENGENYEPNRIRETSELFLIDANKLTDRSRSETEFLNVSRLYSDGDYEVNVSVPANIPYGSRAKIRVEVLRVSDAEKPFSINCVLQTPAFTDERGEHELIIKADEILPEKGVPASLTYKLKARENENSERLDDASASFIVKSNFAKIVIGGVEARIPDGFILKSRLADASAEELVEREIAKTSLEARSIENSTDYIKLANITIQRTKNAYIIDKIDEYSAKSYIKTISREALRREYLEWFGGRNESAVLVNAGESVRSAYSPRVPEQTYATGICEIALGTDARKGSVVYSDEIMHGLGKGNVFVSIGFEYLAEDAKLKNTAKNTIYGDASLFGGKGSNGELPVVYADTAVKVMGDRGSFIAAAKLTKDTNYVALVLRWVAVKLPSGEEQTLLKHVTDKSISAEQPTVVLGTKESCFFNVIFKNMEAVTLNYTLTESDSGTISSDGIYTAPNKEGVYEILISCADMPMIRTYAYAVVKKKELEDTL